jgi:hypothetical protein
LLKVARKAGRKLHFDFAWLHEGRYPLKSGCMKSRAAGGSSEIFPPGLRIGRYQGKLGAK